MLTVILKKEVEGVFVDQFYSFNSVLFPSRIMNASGPLCTWEQELNALGESASGAIVLKTTTFEPRAGNDRPKYFENEWGSINSNGLENLGYKKYCELIPKLKRFNKPVISSLSGFSLEEFTTMVGALDQAGADILEINLSCPNIAGKPQVAYDFEMSEKYLHTIRSTTEKPLWVKLPPYFETIHRQEMARILLKNEVNGVTLINSLGNALIVDPEKEQAVIKPKQGLGGVGGKYVKPVALGNVFTFSQELENKIPVIGVGGIYTGMDAFEFFLCGAQLVQIGTAYKSQGPGIFARVQGELNELLQRKNYARIEDAIGKLKVVEGEEYGFGA
ncbi:MAG: dihydroorotate oxidase [Candidatus Diapherotrites archaeon]|nr:dihydroorotate oxidase [Candidatus Diapherotrites archaeon]